MAFDYFNGTIHREALLDLLDERNANWDMYRENLPDKLRAQDLKKLLETRYG